ncbi:MAG: acyl-CoA thioesterase [Bacteroidia bacterium]|nr:acyl-CoA thioesterase [Bacteroidia bacterium]
MFIHETKIRVGYADTDQMGYAHHSNYAKYCETARWEAMRELGINYKEIEEKGILMPVISMKFDFIKPAFFDDLLTVKTIIKNLPKARMIFEYELYNESGILISTAEITLAFIREETRKACIPPEYCLQPLMEYFFVKEFVK